MNPLHTVLGVFCECFNMRLKLVSERTSCRRYWKVIMSEGMIAIKMILVKFCGSKTRKFSENIYDQVRDEIFNIPMMSWIS